MNKAASFIALENENKIGVCIWIIFHINKIDICCTTEVIQGVETCGWEEGSNRCETEKTDNTMNCSSLT